MGRMISCTGGGALGLGEAGGGREVDVALDLGGLTGIVGPDVPGLYHDNVVLTIALSTSLTLKAAVRKK